MKCFDLKCFIPAKDYALSINFYKDLGFTENWTSGEVTEFQIGSFRFLLQNFYNDELAKNLMIHLVVDSAETWYDSLDNAIDLNQYPGARLQSPKKQPWGVVTAFLTDPSGVLWHIAQQDN